MKKITTKLMALLLGGSMLLSTGCDFMSSVTGLFGESASTDEHIHSFAVKKVAEEYLKDICCTKAKFIYETRERLLKELEEIDISNLTPMDALNTLYRLQNQLKNRW